MIRILDNRSTGKTSRLMLLAKENNATFVCSNPQAMQAKARAYGITGINFISYHAYLNSRGQKLGNVVIDELEGLIASCAIQKNCGENKIIGYTLSIED